MQAVLVENLYQYSKKWLCKKKVQILYYFCIITAGCTGRDLCWWKSSVAFTVLLEKHKHLTRRETTSPQTSVPFAQPNAHERKVGEQAHPVCKIVDQQTSISLWLTMKLMQVHGIVW